MLHGKWASRLVSGPERLQKFSVEMDDHKCRLVRRRGIIHVGNFQDRARRDVRPIDSRVESLNQFGVRMALFGHQLEFRFEIQRRLL